MFDTLFPGWENPGTLAVIVGLRAFCNGSLALLLGKSLGSRSSLTATVAGLTVLSTALTVLLLRPEGPGLYASYFELGVQIALLVLAGIGVYHNPSTVRVAVGSILGVCAAALLLLMVPIYGEAFVAP